MSDAITYWWRKYTILRTLKSDYLRQKRELAGMPTQIELLEKAYFNKIIEEIK